MRRRLRLRRLHRPQHFQSETHGAIGPDVARREQRQHVALHLIQQLARGVGFEGHLFPACRHGWGVGRALISAAENDFSDRNITRLAVNTRFTREEAHKFYESLGYTRNGFRFVKTLSALAD